MRWRDISWAWAAVSSEAVAVDVEVLLVAADDFGGSGGGGAGPDVDGRVWPFVCCDVEVSTGLGSEL